MLKSGEPVLTSDGSWTRHSARYGQTYHSHHGAATEARHVFLEASRVADRLCGSSGVEAGGEVDSRHDPKLCSNSATTHVLEIGFGLGLNCLLTADLAYRQDARLCYHAVENDPAVLTQVADLQYEQLLHAPALHERLVRALDSLPRAPESMPEHAEIALGDDILLQLSLMDAQSLTLPAERYHAIYLDAFSPDSNPECWSDDFLTRLHECTAPGGVLTTYSAKGVVRRSLQAAGFAVTRLPGPPGKREMLQAVRETSQGSPFRSDDAPVSAG